MDILKNGVIESRWVGQCRECTAILMSNKDELGGGIINSKEYDDEYIIGDCIFCSNEKIVVFFRLRSTSAKKLLRNHDIRTIYKKET